MGNTSTVYRREARILRMKTPQSRGTLTLLSRSQLTPVSDQDAIVGHFEASGYTPIEVEDVRADYNTAITRLKVGINFLIYSKHLSKDPLDLLCRTELPPQYVRQTIIVVRPAIDSTAWDDRKVAADFDRIMPTSIALTGLDQVFLGPAEEIVRYMQQRYGVPVSLTETHGVVRTLGNVL